MIPGSQFDRWTSSIFPLDLSQHPQQREPALTVCLTWFIITARHICPQLVDFLAVTGQRLSYLSEAELLEYIPTDSTVLGARICSNSDTSCTTKATNVLKTLHVCAGVCLSMLKNLTAGIECISNKVFKFLGYCN